ncbi:MAG: hypothetical protein MUE96_04840 [Bacteroidia bacterium]|jgi:hypothetical protein|nr:hypothetical protein [Bacteroidia bacterium]
MKTHTISETVVKLSKIGRTRDILEAITKERESGGRGTGKSSDGKVVVVRVGASSRK